MILSILAGADIILSSWRLVKKKHLFGIGIKMRIDRKDLKEIPTQT
jgi:hypothetical protein